MPKVKIQEFRYVTGPEIYAQDVIDLRVACGYGTQTDTAVWRKCIEESLGVFGARENYSDTLIGVGFLAGNARQAIFGDFTVHPNWQGRGIGTHILRSCISVADELGIPYVYAYLADPSSFNKPYIELGFESAHNVILRDTRHGLAASQPSHLSAWSSYR